MDIPFSRYTEKLPEEFSVRHKITETTEKKNFHLHRQMEIIFALSGNLKCKFETGSGGQRNHQNTCKRQGGPSCGILLGRGGRPLSD